VVLVNLVSEHPLVRSTVENVRQDRSADSGAIQEIDSAIGNIDISAMVALFALQAVQQLLNHALGMM